MVELFFTVSHSTADNSMAAVFMSRIDRLFELVQELRRAQNPLTGRALAEKLEVSLRTIYRDCASLQAMGIPIDGEAGIGYLMRRGYDLPPLAFSPEEQEALVMGLRMLGRTGDTDLLGAADKAMSKLAVAASISESTHDPTRFVSQAGAPDIHPEISAIIRHAISKENKLKVIYEDRLGHNSDRIIWPLCLIYYPDATVVSAWCEMRKNFRHFRLDWLVSATISNGDFVGKGASLRQTWREKEDWPTTYPGAMAGS